jgi:hypothetical protein
MGAAEMAKVARVKRRVRVFMGASLWLPLVRRVLNDETPLPSSLLTHFPLETHRQA